MVTEKALIEYLMKRGEWGIREIRCAVGSSWCRFCGEPVHLQAVAWDGSPFGFCSDLAACEERAKTMGAKRAKSVTELLADITLPEVEDA